MAAHATTNQFGNELERQIELRGIAYAEFARRVGVDVTTGYRWRMGTSHPDAATTEKIAEVLGIPVSVFANVNSAPVAEGMRTAIAEMETTLGRLRETADRIEDKRVRLAELPGDGDDGEAEAEAG